MKEDETLSKKDNEVINIYYQVASENKKIMENFQTKQKRQEKMVELEMEYKNKPKYLKKK